MLLTELAMAGGALYYGAKAYHKRHRQKTCALFLQPTKAATTVHTVKGGESGKSALQDEALVLHLGATATPVASSDSGRLLALCQVLRREVTPWFSFPLYRTRADEAAQSQGRLSQSQSGSSWTFEAVDSALQAFVRRWIDPLFGDTGNSQLQALGVTLHMAAVSPAEQMINRFFVVSVASLGLTLAGTSLYPPLLVLGAAGTVYASLPQAVHAYQSLVKNHKFTSTLTVVLGTLLTGLGGFYVAAAINPVLFHTTEKLIYKAENRTR